MNFLLFIITALIIALVGSYLTKVADRLADQSGIGEALMGGIFLGASTSLSGTITSVASAAHGHTSLSISNALGGIALQTFFLCIADINYKKSNLEHASVSTANIMMGLLLILLLTIPILAQNFSQETYLSIHPVTLGLFAVYILGFKYIKKQQQQEDMWLPKETNKTVKDRPKESRIYGKLPRLWFMFAFLSALLAISGYFIEKIGISIASDWNISHLVLGTIFTALATSLPELIVTIVAIKRNAVTLAIGGIIGGNTYDILFLGLSDIAYRDGSLYHEMQPDHFSLIALNIAMTSLLLMGLIRREKNGLSNIGTETWAMIIIFIGGMTSILW